MVNKLESVCHKNNVYLKNVFYSTMNFWLVPTYILVLIQKRKPGFAYRNLANWSDGPGDLLTKTQIFLGVF